MVVPIKNIHPATVIRWRDADTVILKVHQDYHTIREPEIHRLAWIQAPERYTMAGKVSTARVNEVAPPGSLVLVETFKLDGDMDNWGRWLADVICDSGSISQLLLQEGLAVPYLR